MSFIVNSFRVGIEVRNPRGCTHAEQSYVERDLWQPPATSHRQIKKFQSRPSDPSRHGLGSTKLAIASQPLHPRCPHQQIQQLNL
jgi:hypothetical protein